MTQPFVLGVNYWPRRKAMYWWNDFDPGEVREEFAIIREIGLEAVRLFLLWDDFQPEPDRVDRQVLDRLVTVAEIAAENKLVLDATFFTGHMSGPNWSPKWLLGGTTHPYQGERRDIVSRGRITGQGYRNMFHDPMALQATELLLRTVVGALKDHPAIWMWNLGNEPDLFAWPNDYKAGREWARRMVALIHSIDSMHVVTCGLHGASLHQNNGLRVDQVFAETDAAVMHSYPMYTPWARKPLDPDFVPFTCALTAALCGRPVLMEEFGGCTAQPGEPSQIMKWKAHNKERTQFMASEEDLAEFLRLTLPKLQDSGATGALIWCYADYARELWDRPPCDNSQHERFFGLVRPDGTLKPHAKVLKEFAATRPEVRQMPEYAKLTVDPEKFYGDQSHHLSYLTSLYEQYLRGLEESSAA